MRNRLELIVLSALCAVVAGLPFLFAGDSPTWNLLEQPVLILLPTLLISGWYSNRQEISFKSFYQLSCIDAGTIALLTLLAVALPFLTYFVANVSIPFFGDTMQNEEVVNEKNMNAGLFFLYNIFYMAIIPGICEEILFRGSILSLLKRIHANKYGIIVINGLLFGIFHMNLTQFFYTTVLGIVLAIAVLITRSIFSAIYIHIVYNTIAFLPDLITIPEDGLIPLYLEHVDTLNNGAYAAAACIVIGVVFSILHQQKQKRTPLDKEFTP